VRFPLILLWLLPALLAATAAWWIGSTVQKRRAQNLVHHSNYIEAQRRRYERLATTKFNPPGTSVRVLTSTTTGQTPGRHRLTSDD